MDDVSLPACAGAQLKPTPEVEPTASPAVSGEKHEAIPQDGALHQALFEPEGFGGEPLDGEEGRILTLPPPPSYDVHITSLSIGVPPYRLYIPTPIPIPIPSFITDGFRNRSAKKKEKDAAHVGDLGPKDDLIVRNVTAQVKRGEMMAIIGGSGSGKTTLLHAIANRLGGLPVIEGGVKFVPSAGSSESQGNEGPLGKKGLSEVVGFVRQHDYLLPHLTVRETLTYAAHLRLPVSARPYIEQIVLQTIQELGLAECADTSVGGTGDRKGISGGEKRRLSIGCVLVSFPSVLILDEVTTGLDSFTAFQLLRTLSHLASRGRTIVLSLHQPRSDAFALFSRILLLSGGSVVYSGPTSQCLPYFKSLGLQPQERTNPLDFLIDISSVDTRDDDEEKESRERVQRLTQCWKDKEIVNEEKQGTLLLTDAHKGITWKRPTDLEASAGSANIASSPSDNKRPNVLQQAVILTPRATKTMYRAYPELIGLLLQALLLGTVVGITYFRLPPTPNGIQSLKTVCFQIVPVYSYLSQVVWTYKWCLSLVIFDREFEDRLYKPAAWIMSEFVAWLPINVISPFLYTVLVYFVCGLRTDDLHYYFGVVVVDMILVQLCFVSWGLFAASIERSFARASLLGNALAIFFLLSPGFFVVNVPGWIRWFRWISPHFFSFHIITISQFRDRTFACEGVTGPALSQCTGENALRALRLSPTQPLWPMFLGLTGFLFVTLFLSWLLLTLWKPGGVRHARRVTSDYKGKEISSPELDIIRARVDVVAEQVRLRHVRRTVPSWEKIETQILTDVSARFPSGEVSVIMGPSGSGKSTFLRMCAGRTTKTGLTSSFESEGQILFNGVPVSKRTRHICAFVEQDDDYHLPALTVRETLRFAAIIKLPSNISRKNKIARAEEVLKMLGLRECADIMVGGELLKGISGGEKRRLSLACQMINDPAVLIADEPTSGLDANTARNVMEALQDIARSGRTVIASLHQPRSDIYNMADNFTILAKQGSVVYSGTREQLLPYLALVGHVCPPLYNPSDYCMDLISVDVKGRDRQEASTARIKTLVDSWKTRHEKLAEFMLEEPKTSDELPGELEDKAEHTPIWIALPVVLERTLRNTWRQPDLFWTRWMQAPILAICFFLFFLRLNKGPTGAQDRIGLIAECTTAIAFVGFLNLAALYPMEKTVFFHDYKSAGGRYSSATFIVAFTLFGIVPEFISALVFSVIMNVATGMQTNARIFFEYTIAVWMQLSFGESIGIAFASYFNTMGISVSLVSVFLSVAGQASSVLSASLTVFLNDIAWISPMKYAARIMFINEMRGLQFNCSPADIADGSCTAVDGQQLIDLFGFQSYVPWKLCLVGVAITIAYRIAAWAVLSARMRYV